MSIQPLGQIEERDYGDELWFGGSGAGLLTVGEWSAGGCKGDPDDWAELQKQANLIKAAPEMLQCLETIKRRMYEPRALMLADVEAMIDVAIAHARGGV